MAAKGDIKFPYEWQYSGSYFCFSVEYDLQGCLCHLRFKSYFQEWHCAVLVSFSVRIKPLNLLGSLEYVAVFLNLPLDSAHFKPTAFARMCMSNLPVKGLSHGGLLGSSEGCSGKPVGRARTQLVSGRKAWPDYGGAGKSRREFPEAPEWVWSMLFQV